MGIRELVDAVKGAGYGSAGAATAVFIVDDSRDTTGFSRVGIQIQPTRCLAERNPRASVFEHPIYQARDFLRREFGPFSLAMNPAYRRGPRVVHIAPPP